MRVVLDDQAVVAGGAEWRGDACEDIGTGVGDRADLPVHRFGRADYLAAERLADCLVPEADAEQRDLAGGRCNQIQADAGFRGRAGARRQHDRFGLHCDRIGDGQLVVAPHLALGADVAQKVKEVEGEAVVVVDEKDHGPQTLNARSTLVARSLLVERYLWSGGDAAVNHGSGSDGIPGPCPCKVQRNRHSVATALRGAAWQRTTSRSPERFATN